MEMMIVYGCLAAAVAYAGWRIWKAMRAAGDPCYGCEGCALRDMKRKKDCEKFGNKK